MKKVEIKGKLSLDKMTIAKLNGNMTNDIKGGAADGFLSIGKNCTKQTEPCCPDEKTNGIWCK